MSETNRPIELDGLYADREPPDSLRDAVRGRVFSDPSWSRSGGPIRSLRAVAGFLLFLGGYWLGGRSSPSPIGGATSYVLLTYGTSTDGPSLEEDRVAAMAGWIGDRRESDPSTTGYKLSDARYVLGEAEGTPGAGATPISGLFRFTAENDDAALAVARDHPHVRWGGRIELRPIER